MRQFLLILVVLLSGGQIWAQTQVSGTVTDNEGMPLPGVTIVQVGTTNGTITDVDGKYTITVPADASLSFSYVGYETKTVPVNGKSTIDVTLTSQTNFLDELVVVGYGTQKKSVTTGAISKVKAEDLESMPVARIEQSLAGRASGITIVSNSGQPGAAATVRIRGTTTINNSNPLYVVDGVPIQGGIEYLNQGDIASIEVLKDAASAAIYGARAANGVILVTTKKGKVDQMRVNYNAYYGVQSPWKKLTLLNAEEYAILMNESSAAAGNDIIFENPQALGEGTDWQDQVFRYNAPMQNHDISLAAGSEKSNYYVSFSFYDQAGIVSDNDSRFQRFTGRFNSSHQISDRFRFGQKLSFTRIGARGVAENTEFGSPLNRAINLDPLTPVYETDPGELASPKYANFPVVKDENGTFAISDYVTSEIVNPLAALYVQNNRGWSDKWVGNIFGEADIIEGLTFRSSFGFDIATYGDESFVPVHYLNATNRVDVNSYARSQNRGFYYIWENTLRYEKRFGDHFLSILAGSVAERNAGSGIGGRIFDIPVTDPDDASLAFPTPAETQTFYGFEYLNTLASLLGRVQYNYKEKYLATLILRRDGSSKFGANYKFGYFPSVAVGWVISQEEFLRKNDYVQFLKLRASYGINGNDKIGDFRYISTVSGGRNYTFGYDETLVNGVSPNAIANPDLRWKKTIQYNAGLDAVIFKDFTTTIEYFYKNTTDMLLDIAVPGYVGNNGPVGNIASMINNGLEFELGYNKKFGELQLNFTGNISYIHNEVTFLGQDKEFLPGQVFSPQSLEITRTSVGQPIGYFFGYQTDGIFQNQAEVDAYVNDQGEPLLPDAAPGDFRFVDVNGDGIIDADDRTVLGDPTPNVIYGFTLNASWRQFDLTVFGQGMAGHQIFNATRRFDLQMTNMTANALERWTGEGTSTTYPRLIMNDPNKNFSRSSDFYVEDASFFRLRTVQIGYTLPKSIANKISMANARIYVSANNLYTFTKYSGYDPEIGGGSFGVDRGNYPQPRSYMVGVNVTFK